MTNFKIEGQCVNCENMAVEEVLDINCYDYVSVCEDCFKVIFVDVVNQGIETFFEWASDSYGEVKAFGLCKEIYGESALASLTRSEGSEDDMKMVTIVTYGILKYRKNIEREGGNNIVENCIVSGHVMHLYNNSYPITRMTNNPNDKIYGTLFDVPSYIVKNQYDFIEGYNPKEHPSRNMYNRIEVEVTTPSGEKKLAQMYYANQQMFARDLTKHTCIPTGNFDDKHLAKSYSSWKKK